jgi:branched-chain amino acid transport system permease protein
MRNPQVKAIRLIEILLLVSAVALFAIGSILGDTFFLRLATESLNFCGLSLAGVVFICILGLGGVGAD